VKSAIPIVIAAVLLSSCTTSYPYLITTDNCNCESFVYHDGDGRFEIEASARYEVTDRITSTIELVFRNRSRDTLSLRQAFLKGSSANVRYQFNGKYQPMPFVIVPPGGKYTLTLAGSDTQLIDDPWLKIAGERIDIEMRGLLLGFKPVPPIQLTLVPYNPKLGS
jgi:hypothetical protein